MSTRRRPSATLAGGARGVETYTRVSLYLFVFLEPFFYLYALAALTSTPGEMPDAGPASVLVVLALVHMALCLGTVHVGFDGPLATGGRPRPMVVALLVATCAVMVAAVVVLPPYTGGGLESDPRTVMIGVCGAAACGALAVATPIRRIALAGLAVPAAMVAARLADPAASDAGAVAVAVAAYVFLLFWAGTARLSMWVVEVVRELDAARQVSARLAVAEERLRIARDMHDVVGRALSAVAVKSELAAALARRGDPRAAGEMDDVRTLAQDSLREVRGVVAGYRAADLATELDGARSVLHAAGVAVRVVGDVPHLAAPQADALAWVVRESVTNIVRHSAARECRIDLIQEAGQMVLRVDNDGARPDAARVAGLEGGTGLVGLRERLAAVGGELGVTADGERFVLEARVPAPPLDGGEVPA